MTTRPPGAWAPGHPVQAKKPLAAWTKQVPDPKLSPLWESHRSRPGMGSACTSQSPWSAQRGLCV